MPLQDFFDFSDFSKKSTKINAFLLCLAIAVVGNLIFWSGALLLTDPGPLFLIDVVGGIPAFMGNLIALGFAAYGIYHYCIEKPFWRQGAVSNAPSAAYELTARSGPNLTDKAGLLQPGATVPEQRTMAVTADAKVIANAAAQTPTRRSSAPGKLGT